jgi:hypothetical protein
MMAVHAIARRPRANEFGIPEMVVWLGGVGDEGLDQIQTAGRR